jgi:hypothetical protein
LPYLETNDFATYSSARRDVREEVPEGREGKGREGEKHIKSNFAKFHLNGLITNSKRQTPDDRRQTPDSKYQTAAKDLSTINQL